MIFFRQLLPALSAALIWFFSPGIIQAVELLPHQAVYKMSLAQASSKSGVSDARGVMVYKFEETCDGWASETNVFLKLLYSEGEEIDTTWSMVSWESKDGLKYRFRVRQNRNGQQVENLQGSVNRKSVDDEAVAEFSSPEGKVIKLPEGTMFPTRHLQALIREGERGTLTYTRIVFDGASLDNPYSINALITGKPRRKKTGAGKNTEALRHIRMAFFPIASRAEFPEFELGIDYRANGVADFIVQDFGDFSLNLIPDNIETLAPPDC